MYFGVDWYPDQWGMEQVDEDLKDIKELGCDFVRIADFAWHYFEPEDGRYEFGFFDEVVKRVREQGLKILFCIPTATMPPWMVKNYPDIIAEDETGRKIPYGGRRAYCMNSEDYRRKSYELTKAIVSHYKGEPSIIAWQVDNEIGHEGSDMCWCENCHKKFTEVLAKKYRTTDELNKRWGTDFWTHHYDAFEEVPLPKKAFTAQNPSLRMEFERFRSQSAEEYIKLLTDAVREADPDAYVLHDFSGGMWDKHYDPFKVAKPLDTIAFNNYPVWGGMAVPHRPAVNAFYLDFSRGLKQQNYWITEEIMGAQGHDVIGAAPKPNQAIVWAMQAMAHGCENMSFFRYRGFNKGAEQYCFGIVDADNRKKRKYREVQKFIAEAKKWEDAFTSPIKNDVAIVYDYDSASAFRIQQQSSEFSYEWETISYYEQLWNRGIGCDVLSSEMDFSKYKLVILSSMIVMSEDYKKKLKDYVRNGGTVIFTSRTAWKDLDNNIPFKEILPAGLTDLIGATLEEQESLLKDQYRDVVSRDGKTGKGTVFAEMMEPTSAEVLYEWKDCLFGDYAAVLKNHYGEGTAYYLGTSLEKDLLKDLFEDITKTADLSGTPNGEVETIIRHGKDGDYSIALDYRDFSWDIKKLR